uniref:Zona pellucida protein AX 4 n=1 Tax=Sinocyclocheilus grahami TaxID=75366 RepID=A0A672RNI8_SINGR
MAFGLISGGLLLLCAVTWALHNSKNTLQHCVLSYGAQCGYTYSVQPLWGRVVFRASYFSCHTDNQVQNTSIMKDHFQGNVNICSVPPFSPRVVTCEENYMEAQSSAVESLQVVLQQEGQQSQVISAEGAAALGYFIKVTAGRLVFRTTSWIQATVFFRQNWMVVMVDLVAACSLGTFDGYRLHWRTPAVMTPLVVGRSEFRSEYIDIGVDGYVVDGQAAADRGYSVVVREEVVDCSIPFAAGGMRRSFVTDNVYYELYMVQLTYQQVFVDQHGVKTMHNVVRQMAIPPIPYPLFFFSVNQTIPEERVFMVYLGNIPFDVELVSVELNGEEISVLTATEMGYSITRVPEGNNTFAYIIRVPFGDQFVVKAFEYSLEIKWTLNIMPQMEDLLTFFLCDFPPVFDCVCVCADYGISFMKDHKKYDYLWDITIGPYTLTSQLASERGYIMTNYSTTLVLDVPLFTIEYVYENITLQQFYGTFELLTRNSKTLKIEKSSAKRCLFQTTELLVCSTEGVMTVLSDITKVVPTADPARTTLLDTNCRPQETDESRVLFSFGLDTCGTRFQVCFPSQMLKPMQLQKQSVMKPSFQGPVARKPADSARVGWWR